MGRPLFLYTYYNYVYWMDRSLSVLSGRGLLSWGPHLIHLSWVKHLFTDIYLKIKCCYCMRKIMTSFFHMFKMHINYIKILPALTLIDVTMRLVIKSTVQAAFFSWRVSVHVSVCPSTALEARPNAVDDCVAFLLLATLMYVAPCTVTSKNS